MKSRPVALAAAVITIAAGQPALAERISGRVVGVAEGGTLTVLAKGHPQVRVRLAGIQAPERRQPYGARQALAALAFGRSALVEVEDTNRYGCSAGTRTRRRSGGARLGCTGAATAAPP